jgi:hypothetical protein
MVIIAANDKSLQRMWLSLPTLAIELVRGS